MFMSLSLLCYRNNSFVTKKKQGFQPLQGPYLRLPYIKFQSVCSRWRNTLLCQCARKFFFKKNCLEKYIFDKRLQPLFGFTNLKRFWTLISLTFLWRNKPWILIITNPSTFHGPSQVPTTKTKSKSQIDRILDNNIAINNSLSLSLKSLNETPNREFDASFKDFYVKSALELYVATWFWKMGEIS